MTVLKGQLFESVVARQGATVLPGRYGGDEGGDRLAFIVSDHSITLLLGLKVLDANGGFRLGKSDAGYLQYSSAWIRVVIDQLKPDSSTTFEAVKIEEALEAGALVAGVICLNSETQQLSNSATQQVSVHRIAIR